MTATATDFHVRVIIDDYASHPFDVGTPAERPTHYRVKVLPGVGARGEEFSGVGRDVRRVLAGWESVAHFIQSVPVATLAEARLLAADALRLMRGAGVQAVDGVEHSIELMR